MKIMREKSREYKERIYYKYRINIPEEIIKESGFKEGDELQTETKKGEIKLKKK